MPLLHGKLMLGSLAQVILTDSRIRRLSDSVKYRLVVSPAKDSALICTSDETYRIQEPPTRAHTGCRVFKRSSHNCKGDEDNASVKTRKTNHIRMYLPERVTSHPQSWSCSAVWARFCGNMHRLYMPFIWHLTIAMTRDCKKYCHLLRLRNSHWLNCVPALSQTHFRVLGQWFLPHR